MMSFLKGAGLALVLVITGWLIGSQFRNAMVTGTSKRTVADIQTVAAAVEQYRADNGHYPIGSRIQQLEPLLTPKYETTIPTWGLSYFSDGNSYTIYGTPFAEEPQGSQRFAPFQFRDGRFISWPSYMGLKNDLLRQDQSGNLTTP